MTEQIKSAIEEFDEIVEDIAERGESPCYFGEDDLWYLKLSIHSLQAWEEVLNELEKKNALYMSYLSNKENPYDSDLFGKHIAVENCIDIINQKLEQNEEYFERFIYPIAYDEPFNEAIKNKTYNQALEDFANALVDGEQNEEFVYNIEKIVKRLRK